jgi:chemotaxis protein CheX
MIEQLSIKEIVLESAKEVFETMIFMDITETTEPDSDIEGWAILGLITFRGAMEGCLAICCSTPCAQTISMNMLGIDSAEQVSEADTCDAIGEVANMIVGRVKKHLAKTVGNIEISIPSVVNGREIKNNLGNDAELVTAKVNIEDKYVAKLSMLYRKSSK